MVQESCHWNVAGMVTFCCNLSAYTALIFSLFLCRFESMRGEIVIKGCSLIVSLHHRSRCMVGVNARADGLCVLCCSSLVIPAQAGIQAG